MVIINIWFGLYPPCLGLVCEAAWSGLDEIEEDIKSLEANIMAMLGGVV